MNIKEYGIQAYNEERYGKKWVLMTKPKKSPEAAIKTMEAIRDFQKTNPGQKYKTPIVNFRVVMREVSEWEPIE